MKDITTALMQQFRREHKAARRHMALLLALALLTSLFVNWQLHSVGIAQTADYQCGEIEHQHTAECYEKVLVCGYEEGEPEDWNATKPDDSAFPDADYGAERGRHCCPFGRAGAGVHFCAPPAHRRLLSGSENADLL